METLEKQTRAARLLNQAKILRYKAIALEPEIASLKKKLFLLQSRRTSLNIAADHANGKAIALEREFFDELDLVIRKAPPKPLTLYEIAAAKYGKADADLIKDDLEALVKEAKGK